MHVCRPLAVAMFLAVVAAPSFGQEAGMMRADAAFVGALTHGDKAGLEKLLDPEFTWTNAHGRILTRSEVLREIPKSVIANANAGMKAYTYGDLGNVQANLRRAHVLRVWVKRPAGWKAIAYQELMSLEAPLAITPGAGKDCENPCRTIAFTPSNRTEREVALAYEKLETAAHARNSAAFGPMVGDEFVAASSNSDKLSSKRSRMADFDRSKDSGVAPTPLVSARMFVFGNAVLMVSEHRPDRGKPLHVTRVWVKRDGDWVETVSYQTAVTTAQ